MANQSKQKQWKEQWETFSDNEFFLFEDWIYPNKISDFEDKQVLECGCGGGQHTSFIAPHCQRIVAVDLNALDVAKERNAAFENIEYVEDDVAKMELGEKFDIVFSIGVVHHTDDPDATVANMRAHVRPGGRIIIWTYSREGNWLAINVVERFRKLFLAGASTTGIMMVSRLLTLALYIPIYTIYRLPIKSLPYFEYFDNFRKLGFNRNLLNVFDKLNAPQVEFISYQRASEWFPPSEFKDIHIDQYKGVSWRASATYNGANKL